MADRERIDMENLTCGPHRLPCTPDMTWIERAIAIGWDEDPATGCWEWRGTRTGPYKRARIGTRHHGRRYAYRVTYEAVNGPIPEGLSACHTCENPGCVNPAHIIPGTQLENMAMISRERIQKFSVEDAAIVRRVYETGRTTQAQIGASMGLSQKTISRMIRGDVGPNRMSATHG